MLSRILLRNKASLVAVSRANVRAMSEHGPGFKPMIQLAQENKSSMDFQPVPEGSWQDHHRQRNSRWNMQLAGSVLLLVATLGAMVKQGMWYLHSEPDLKTVKIQPQVPRD